MKITLNGQDIITQQRSLQSLLEEQGYDKSEVATAIDNQFVPKSSRTTTRLVDGAVVEVVAPMQGG